MSIASVTIEHDKHKIVFRVYGTLYNSYGLEIELNGRTVHNNPHSFASESYGADFEDDEGNELDEGIAWSEKRWRDTIESEWQDLFEGFVGWEVLEKEDKLVALREACKDFVADVEDYPTMRQIDAHIETLSEHLGAYRDKPLRVLIVARLWRDRHYGNTYWSTKTFFDGKLVMTRPCSYGYGRHYLEETFMHLSEQGHLDIQRHPDGRLPVASYWFSENGIELTEDVVTVTRKRDLHQEDET